jgi:hypothetical protein
MWSGPFELRLLPFSSLSTLRVVWPSFATSLGGFWILQEEGTTARPLSILNKGIDDQNSQAFVRLRKLTVNPSRFVNEVDDRY